MPTLRIKRMPVGEDLLLPAYQTAGAAGLDLRAACLSFVMIHPRQTVRISTGIAVEIPDGFEGQVRPRSGLSLQGVKAVLGTIDSDYRGEVGVIIENTGPETVTIRRGDRIAQLVISPIARCSIFEVQELGASERGERGFGSTGVG